MFIVQRPIDWRSCHEALLVVHFCARHVVTSYCHSPISTQRSSWLTLISQRAKKDPGIAKSNLAIPGFEALVADAWYSVTVALRITELFLCPTTRHDRQQE
jgi:hypothetical protein